MIDNCVRSERKELLMNQNNNPLFFVSNLPTTTYTDSCLPYFSKQLIYPNRAS